jgi:hydroxymethylglutaryl-CoA reductase (NADPH)
MNSTFSWQALSSSGVAKDQVVARQEWIAQQSSSQADYSQLFSTQLDMETISRKNCENVIGSVEIPVGVAGPLPLRLDDWQIDALIPLATTEGALVASVNRGCKSFALSGGTEVMVEKRGMTRSPVFECPSGLEAKKFQVWFEEHMDKVKAVAESTSEHLHLLSHHTWIRGRFLYVRFAFDTEEAMGMNMVTIALQKALEEALQRHPEIKLLSLSSNVCTDKKDSVVNSLLGRGYWVQAEATLPQEVIATVLKSTAQRMFQVHIQKNLIGSNLAGSFSQNAHVANVLAAMYIATGQDPAHIVEGSKAFLTIEPQGEDLYVALTLPNINVGAVGGGTGIVAQQQARLLINKGTPVNAVQLAATVGAAALAGELSLLAALAEQQLAFAHAKLGRDHREAK